MTVMLCDIVGSTVLSTRLDAEEYGALLALFFQAWNVVIKRYGGFIARNMGDAVLVYFGYPFGDENAAERAVQAALEIVGLAPARTGNASIPAVDVAVRVGIATGLVVVGDLIGEGASAEHPAFGVTPNLAARLRELALPNTVVIAAETQQLIGRKFECDCLGLHRVHGFEDPIPAWRVVRELPFQSRFTARRAQSSIKIVGRSRELENLHKHWSSVRDRAGGLVRVSGEPGMGKSHLCEAFLELVTQAPCAVLRFQCSPLHANTAFHPVIEEVERSAGISREDNATERMAKLEVLLRECSEDVGQLMPVFATLLALPTSERYPEFNLVARDARRRIIDGLVHRVLLVSERVPVVLFVEDAQWSDPSTLDLLQAAAERAGSERVLILVTTRSGDGPDWLAASNVAHFQIAQLDRRQAAELVRLAAHERPLTEDLIAQIVDRADGVPLFVEELTRWMLESGDPAIRDQAIGVAASSFAAIPVTLHDSLISQLDRLGDAKSVTQLGGIIGRTFPYWLLARLWPFEETELRVQLAEVVRAGIVVRREQDVEESYTFRHELVRDAAYKSLLKTRRQSLHDKIAQIITAERASSSGMRPELIAHHYTAAGLCAQAAPLWLEAGQLALRESANREARANLQEGLRCIVEMPASLEVSRLELRLQASLGQALIAVHGHASPEVYKALTRAHEMCWMVMDAPELFKVVWGITAHHLVKGDIHLHLDLSSRLLDIARASNDSSQLVVAHTSRTLSHYFSGQFDRAREDLDEVQRRYEWERHRHLAYSYAVDRKVITLQFGSWTIWKLGFPDRAAELEAEMNEHARRLDHPNSLAQALTAGASVYMLRREPDTLIQRVNEGIAVAEAHGYPVWVDHADFWLGWAQAEKGEVEEGITRLERALVAYQKHGAGSSMPKFLGLLADRLGEVGRHDAGLALLEKAIAHIERSGERATEAETYRLRGKLLFARNAAHFDRAEADLLKAIAIARAQEAKGWELRAATTLARILQRQDRRRRARECLAPIHGWFSEGFATSDLEEAEALLRELT